MRGLELCPGAAFRSRLLGALGYVFGRWGKRDRVEAVKHELNRMRQRSYVPAFEAAQIEVGAGNLERSVGAARRRCRQPGQLRGLSQSMALVQAAARRACAFAVCSPGSAWNRDVTVTVTAMTGASASGWPWRINL